MKFIKAVLLYLIAGFIIGAVCLDVMSIVQKLIIQAPMKPHGFIIPTVMGGIAGAIIAIQLYFLRGKNLQLARYLEIERMLHHELEHRVKNNFQYIISVLSLKAMSKQNDPEVQQMLLSCRNRIESVKTLHDLLYYDIENLSTESRIRILVEELMANITGQTEIPRLKLYTDLPAEGFSRDTEYNILQIIIEAVMNSLSFAWDDKFKTPEIRIELFTVNERIFLQISDNGNGMEALTDEGDGLGLKMIYALASQMDADVQIVPKNEEVGGVEIILSFDGTRASAGSTKKTYY